MENQLNEGMFLFVAPWLHQLKNSDFLLHWLINSYIFVLPYLGWRKGFFNNVCKEEETSFWRLWSHCCRKSWWQDEVTRHYWYCPYRSRRGQYCPRGERVDSPRGGMPPSPSRLVRGVAWGLWTHCRRLTMGRTERLSYQYGRTREASIFGIPHSLWHVERAFRIAKSKIEIRMFHFMRRRIEAHVCICFIALKV